MVGSVSHRCWVNISRGKGGRGRAVARPYKGAVGDGILDEVVFGSEDNCLGAGLDAHLAEDICQVKFYR